MSTEMNRFNTHYLDDKDRKYTPKEYFKFLAERARPFVEKSDDVSILDVGCATGDFIYYLRTIFPNTSMCGIDIVDEMLDEARRIMPEVEFLKSDVMEAKTLPNKKFDVIFMAGVMYLFEDYKLYLSNILGLLEDGGKAYIFGMFNPEPIDLYIRVSPVDEGYAGKGEMFILSKERIKKFFDAKKLNYKFVDWNITIPLPKTEGDPMRSWTIKDENNDYIVVNGAQLIHTFSVLEISK